MVIADNGLTVNKYNCTVHNGHNECISVCENYTCEMGHVKLSPSKINHTVLPIQYTYVIFIVANAIFPISV